MKKIILLFALAIAYNITFANTIDTKTALRVAENFWSAVATNEASAEIIGNTGFNNLFIIDINQGSGFVIVSANDHAYPILGYSTDSPAGELNPEIHFWLNQYEQEIEAIAANEVDIEPDLARYINAQWEGLIEGTWSEPKNTTMVAAMLSTNWNQSPYYNYYCPSGTPAGCSAIAMAQVMKYWNHPAIGTGSHSYTCSYGTMSADFGNTTYDWNNMPDRLGSSSSMTQVDAVATLCYHVGVSMNMDYGPDGSGAAILGSYNSAQSALVNYFGYKNTRQGLYKYSYSDANWVQLLKDELDEGRPIIYAGYDNSAGHAFVFDGYNNSDQFHINWGWGGSYNGYFVMGALNPSGGGTGTNTSNTFNTNNQAIIGIEPLPTLKATPNAVLLSRTGDAQTVIVSSNRDDTTHWHAVYSASWLTITPSTGNGNGSLTTIQVSGTENNSGNNRSTNILIIQGDDTATIQVSQLKCLASDMCTLYANMSDLRGDGWEGGYLEFTSTDGTSYGTSTLNGGSYGIDPKLVCSDTVVATWHRGASDSECTFFIENSNGVVWVHHTMESPALSDGDTFLIVNPCGDTGGLDPVFFSLTTNVNDSAYGYVIGGGDSIHFAESRQLQAIPYPGYRFVKWSDQSSENPHSLTVTTNRSITARFSSMGDDTLQYDNGTYKSTLSSSDDIRWGIKLKPEYLTSRPSLNAIKIYNVASGNYTVTVYQGGGSMPMLQVATKTVSLTRRQTYQWVTITLDHPVEIDHQKTLWIILQGSRTGARFAITDWCGSNDGSWFSSDGGTTWGSLQDEEINGTLMVRAVAPIDHQLYTLSLLKNRSKWGSVSGGGQYPYGSYVEISATPNEGYHFERWSDSVTSNPRTIYIKSDTTLRAYFAEGEDVDIDDISYPSIFASTSGHMLTVHGAEGKSIKIFDVMGRCIFSSKQFDCKPIQIANAGVYLISIEDMPSQKVVIL